MCIHTHSSRNSGLSPKALPRDFRSHFFSRRLPVLGVLMLPRCLSKLIMRRRILWKWTSAMLQSGETVPMSGQSPSCLIFFSLCKYLGGMVAYLCVTHGSLSAPTFCRHRRVCHADALLPVQHGVCQPARQPSLRLPARLHQGGRVLLQRYVCSGCLTPHPLLLKFCSR